MRSIKKDDEVIVIAGKDKGKQGKVRSIIKEGTYAVVSGINKYKKSIKANPNENQPGGYEDIEKAIHISNIMRYNKAQNKGERSIASTDKDGKKIRMFVSETKK